MRKFLLTLDETNKIKRIPNIIMMGVIIELTVTPSWLSVSVYNCLDAVTGYSLFRINNEHPSSYSPLGFLRHGKL